MEPVRHAQGFPSIQDTRSPPPSLFEEYLNQAPTHCTFTAILIKFIVDPLVALIECLFSCVFCKGDIGKTEQLRWDHLESAIAHFNREDNQALFFNPNFSMLDRGGPNWNEPDPTNKENPHVSLFSRLTRNAAEEHFNGIDLSQRNVLRTQLTKKNKHLLAMVLNVQGAHWTTIHFNFKDKTIAYLDSFGKDWGKPESKELIKRRLEQALVWIKQLDGEEWRLLQPEPPYASVLKERHQYDSWQCGIFTLHLTYLVAKKGMSYTQIDEIPFADMQRQLDARRKMVREIVTVEHV